MFTTIIDILKILSKEKMKRLVLSCIFLLANLKAADNVIILPYEDLPAMMNLVKMYLPKNPVILEAGAFDGKETIKMKNIWPESTIHTFEPVPSLYEGLIKNIAPYKKVFSYPLALSDSNGKSKFYLSEINNAPGIVSQSSSLLQPKEHLKCADTVVFKNQIMVDTITLDNWAKLNNVDHIDFLWLDMQGYELNALKAAENILKTVKVIVTEVEFVEAYAGQPLYNDVKKWLEEKGFKLVAKNFSPAISHWCWCGDAIFVKI